MTKVKNLEEFCRIVLSCVGTGYSAYKINRIPSKKAQNSLKLSKILDKVEKLYNTNLNKDGRYRNKKQGNANYRGFYFLENIYIFRTAGKQIANQENGFIQHNDKINFKLTENLELDLFRDERKRLTFKLGKTTYLAKKEKIKMAINNQDGRIFHNEIKLLGGFPRYRGIQLQKKELVKFINKLQKSRRVKYTLPKYI
jgi:hypothetical protein